MLSLFGWTGPFEALVMGSVLLLATAIDARRDTHRPLWLRLVGRVAVFGGLTWLLQLAIGSPVAPQFHATSPGREAWERLVEIGWWMLGARVAVGVVRLLVVLENRPRETQIVSDLLAGVIYVSTTLAVVNFVFAVPIGSLVATSGVVAIVLGLALQSTLSDVFSGIAVGLEHAYKPGDLLSVEGGVEGHVLQINWRSTQIATFQNSIAIVPNSIIAKSRLENRSAPTPARGVTVSISADPAVDPRRCLAALQAAARACRLPMAEPAPSVDCVGLLGDGMTFEIHFVVSASNVIAPARTDMLMHVHRHLRHAGVALAISGVAMTSAAVAPTLLELLAESDVFGALPADERAILAEHFFPITRNHGETLIQEDELPNALFLLTSGTVEVTRRDGNTTRVMLRASPGDSLGMIGLITGTPSLVTATALTPIAAYSLDTAAIAAALRKCPGLAANLEAQARRGLDWLRCEVATHEDTQMEHPELLLARLRHFLQRLAI